MPKLFPRLTFSLTIFIAVLASAHAEVTVMGLGTRSFSLAPGEVFADQLIVRNTGSTATGFLVYHTDYLFDADGGNRFDPPGSHPRSNAGWFDVIGEQYYELPVGGQVLVEIRGRVPDDPELHGSYWSTLMVEEGISTADTATDADQAGVGIRIVQRRAIQIISELGGGAAELRFERPQISSDEINGAVLLQLDVHNDGTALSRASGRIEVLNDSGQLVQTVDGRRTVIYPGTSVRWSFELEGLAAGRYEALVLADGGGLDIFGVRYGLDLRGGD